MRGLFLIGLLIALCAVGYLSLKDADQHLQPTAESPENTVKQVEQQVNEITAKHMQRLKNYDK